jgi:RNA polymerase sigma-70 factor, ECF subfamily
MNGIDAVVARKELVRLAQVGDRAAFESLVVPEVARLLRIASAIVGQEFDARDVVQDTLALAWQRNTSLRDTDRFQAWLTRILVNEARHAVKRRGRRRAVEEATIGEGAGRTSQASFEDSIVSQDIIERAFERLDGRQRTLLVLHHLEARPVDEIAYVLEMRPGTVKSQLWSARKALGEALGKEESK